MNRLILHIEFLLHEYDCVIVPGFGGFVVSCMPASESGIATFNPPSCKLGFNADLKSNDGLLAQSYIDVDGLSYDAAVQEIDREANELRQELYRKGSIELPNLGTFTLQEGKIVEFHSSSFVRPEYFGLGKCNLKPILQMPSYANREVKKAGVSSAIGTVAAVAVILLMFFFNPTSNENVGGKQKAQMIANVNPFENSSTIVKIPQFNDKKENVVLSDIEQELRSSETICVLDAEDSVSKQPETSKKYYIITGVFALDDGMKRHRATLVSEGFVDAGYILRAKKYYVYSAYFDDEQRTKLYLRQIQIEFPHHVDAWILEQ